MYGKKTRTPQSVSFDLDRQPLDLMHSDVWSPMPSRSFGGTLYFVTFISNSIIKSWVYAMNSKNKKFSCFWKCLSSMETHHGKNLKFVCSDNDGMYVVRDLAKFFSQRGAEWELTNLYISTQNNVAKWANHTIQKRVMSMLSQKNLPQGVWENTLMEAMYHKVLTKCLNYISSTWETLVCT